MPSDFQFRDKINVGVLGATGSVGQKFVELLANHPWFEVTALAASERSAGKRYKDAVNWFMQSPIPDYLGDMEVSKCEPGLPCTIVFSGLDSSIAGEVETRFAEAGYLVVSNSRNHRMDPDVPLLIPDVNGDHLNLIKSQKFSKGKITHQPQLLCHWSGNGVETFSGQVWSRISQCCDFSGDIRSRISRRSQFGYHGQCGSLY